MNFLKAAAIGVAFGVAGATAQPLSATERTVRVSYSDSRAVMVPAIVDVPVLIELEPGENVSDMVRSSPDQDTWELVKREHRVFVRAKKGAAPTSLTVATKARTYIFDLIPQPFSPEAFSKRTARVVVFLKSEIAPSPEPTATAPEAAPADTAKRNLQYSLQVVSETVDVRPREVFDDGRFTYLRFPNNLEIPTIYRSAPGVNEEWIVNSHREGDYIVMHGVAPLWNIRLAGTVLGIFNEAFDVEGVPPIAGTTVSTLKREIRNFKVPN